MKKIFFLFIILHLSFSIFAQSISLDPNSLQLPRLTVNPTCTVADKGKMIYNTSQEKILYCNGTTWIDPATGGTSSDWLTAGSNTYLSNLSGNVGIGTSSPSYKLDILHSGFTGVRVKSSSSFSVIDIDAANGDGAFRLFNNGVAKWTMNSTTSNDFQIFQHNVTSRLFIESTNGNVGIGTITPSQKLQVAGSAVVDGNLTVNNGKGVAYDPSSATNLKVFPFTTAIFGAVLPGFGMSAETGIVFGGNFTTVPKVIVGDIDYTAGTVGELFRVQLVLYGCKVENASNSSCKARLINTSPNSVNYNITWNCVAIGN